MGDVKQTTVAMAINNVALPFVQPISPSGIQVVEFEKATRGRDGEIKEEEKKKKRNQAQ